MRIVAMLLVVLLLLAGCAKVSDSEQFADPCAENNSCELTANEVLDQNPNADIFQLNGVIYSNASNIDWVQQEQLTLGKKIGTITNQYKDGQSFENGMATTLPVGGEIFEPAEKSGPILIIKLDNKEIRYLGLIEG